MALLATLVASAGQPASAGPAVGDGDGGVAAELVAGGFDRPMYVAMAPGVPDSQYVAERAGLVKRVVGGVVQPQPFLDIRDQVGTLGQRALLSIAFDPDYQATGLLYADYVRPDGDIQVAEFETVSDDDADEASLRRVLRIRHPRGSTLHHGGTIAFGPDGHLYISVGDGGFMGDPDENAQDREKLLGKLLRIDPSGSEHGDYAVPPANPFVGKRGRDEILALGLRNPFRFSIDPATGRIAIADVGQTKREEVNLETAETVRGANFGWDHFEGTLKFDWPGDDEASRPRRNYEPPVFEYRHRRRGGNAVIGGPIVRDPNLPTLNGRYLFADHARGRLRSFVPRLGGGRDERSLGVRIPSPTSFVADVDGVVYATALDDGQLYRLVPAP